MSRRSRAREIVIQVLYEDDLNPDRSPEVADQFLCTRLNADQDLIDFARSLLAGVRKHRAEIDKLLVERADNWTLERMAVTDRNILRLGAYEMLHGGTPERVAIKDRKSTRLNSSHRVISYAVLCSKKKKQAAFFSRITQD